MKTIQSLQFPAIAWEPRVKKFLIKGIIFLTSQNFSIFVCAIAALVTWFAAAIENERLAAIGGLIFLLGFAPWSLRQSLRDLRQDKNL